MLIGIIKNEDPNSDRKWIMSCEKFGVPYKVFDITAVDFINIIVNSKCDFFLLKPPGEISFYKTLFDEKMYILSKYSDVKLFPSIDEVLIYENKRMLAYFLQANNIPHPGTHIAYTKEEAIQTVKTIGLPVVGKTSIGASGSGVIILKDNESVEKYLKSAFSNTGIKRRFGPNRVTGTSKKWLKKTIEDPVYFFKKILEYKKRYADSQKGFVIIQKYVPHDFEWRAVKIGSSYFAHKKIKYGEKASGSKGIEYVNPPKRLLDFLYDLCDRFGFNTMAVDIFENENGEYLVNELQTIFGHVQSHILEVEGLPGRYIRNNGQWIFEPGDFNTNESYDLRLEYALQIFRK